MSASDPRRLVEYGDDLRGLLKNALDAERAAPLADDVDMARLARIGERVAQATAAAGAAASTTSPTPATAGAKAGLGLKAAVVALGAVTVVSALALFSGAGEDPAPRGRDTVATPVAATERTPLSPASAAAVDREPKTMALGDLPLAPDPKMAAARKAPTASEGEEIALLARAQKALRGSPREALALCDEHASTFKNGSFGEEREAVAIEALASLGRKAEASARFVTFQQTYPVSTHRVHLESLFPAD